MKDRLRVVKQIRLTEDVLNKLDEISVELHMTTSQVIRTAIDEYIEKWKGQKAIDNYIEQNKGSETADLLEAFTQFVFDVQTLTAKR